MNVLVRPIKTEKSQKYGERGSFVFEILPSATKHQVKQAVEATYDVRVIRVHTIKSHGKVRRVRRMVRLLPDTKKAIVTLKEGQTIPLFEVEKRGKRQRKP